VLEMTTNHTPVLASELVALLNPVAGELAVDCTYGYGGHAGYVDQRIGPSGRLVVVDRDPEAKKQFDSGQSELISEVEFKSTTFLQALKDLLREGVRPDLIYLDLGVSSVQIDTPQRGFAYSYQAPLDMRMDPRQELTAAQIVNSWDQKQLSRLFKSYGEERYSGRIASEIVRRRAESQLETTQELVEAIKAAVPAAQEFASGHPAKRVFQALRIAVNDEIGQLEQALPIAWEALKPGGRLAVISFHSLEDRAVKRFLGEKAIDCICPPDLPVCCCSKEQEAELLTRHSVKATEQEIAENSRSRSARLRAAIKLKEAGSVSKNS